MAVLRSTRPHLAIVVLLAVASAAEAHSTGKHATSPPNWSVRVRVVEATTGPWPCSHRASTVEASCRYNRVIVVERGEMDNVLLGGAKLWMAGEKTVGSPADSHDWAVVTFDDGVMLEQRTALLTIVRAIYPLQWLTFTVANSSAVELTESDASTAARVGEGSIAELLLGRGKGAAIVPSGAGLRYGDASRVRDVADRPSESQAYRQGGKPFESGAAGGFVLTLEMTSEDIKPAAVEP